MSESQRELTDNLSLTQRTMLAALMHMPEKFNLQMDCEGWVHLLELGPILSAIDCSDEPIRDCDAIRTALCKLELSERIQFSLEHCRATYDHSTHLFAPETSAIPRCSLYHGTSERAFNEIRYFGLHPNRRKFVHPTTVLHCARRVANKLTPSPLIIDVDIASAIKYGIRFYPTGTHVLLPTPIDSCCLRICDVHQAPTTMLGTDTQLNGTATPAWNELKLA